MRMCLETGLWSGSEPSCAGKHSVMFMRVVVIHHVYTCTLSICFISEIDCGSLDDPANGEVSVSSTTFNSVATYSCNTGYNLTEHGIRTCSESGVWSGSEPTCTGKMGVLVSVPADLSMCPCRPPCIIYCFFFLYQKLTVVLLVILQMERFF